MKPTIDEQLRMLKPQMNFSGDTYSNVGGFLDVRVKCGLKPVKPIFKKNMPEYEKELAKWEACQSRVQEQGFQKMDTKLGTSTGSSNTNTGGSGTNTGSTSTPNTSTSGDSSTGMSLGAKIGIGVGLAAIVGLTVWLMRRNTSKNK